MANKHGDFIWYELLTNDANAASEFYGKVVGWTTHNSEHPEMDYRMFAMPDEEAVAGLMAITPEMAEGGAVPAWVGYIAVDDVDGSAKAIKAARGAIYMEPEDIPDVGRIAMVADPQGAAFYIMRGTSEEPSHSFAAAEPKVGHCAWNELATADPEAAKSFYGAQFGWAKDGELDMGPMGKYEFLLASEGRFALGAVMPMMPGISAPMWSFYFRVPDIDAAVHAIKANGGKMLQEPMEIPSGEYSLNAIDPQGTAFGLVGPRV